MSFHLSLQFEKKVWMNKVFFSTVDRGATRRKRCGEDSAVGGGDPGERQGSAAGPRPQSGAEAHGNAGLGGRRRSQALRWGGRHRRSAVFGQSSSTLLFSTAASRWCCSGAAEGREGVCRGTSKSEKNRSSRQLRFGGASSHPCPARLHQINFLNSVIVDLQRKNEELKIKLKKLALAEFNGNDETDGWESTNPFLQKKLGRLKKNKYYWTSRSRVLTRQMCFSSLVGVSKHEKKATPRLFCDICDCFDLHDTEDCPTQAQSPDSVPHTAYHGNPAAERPYCDICEAFGHATESCNDDQTF